jgi:tRNA1Val (adenine37-N6)-methyltransferase
MESVTFDDISLNSAGVVTVAQPRKGVRFTLDSLLLADFCRLRPGDRVLEPGAGSGVVSLLLAKKYPGARFTADEFEPAAYDLLNINIERNGLKGRIVPVDLDLKLLGRSFAPGSFDVIVANPPYTKFGTGRKSPAADRHAARQDEAAPLSAWLGLQALLRNKGRCFMVFSAGRLTELVATLRELKLEPKRLRFVHPAARKPASLVLVEAVKSGGPGLDIMPPLIVHEEDGGYTRELIKLYALPGEASSPAP